MGLRFNMNTAALRKPRGATPHKYGICFLNFSPSEPLIFARFNRERTLRWVSGVESRQSCSFVRGHEMLSSPTPQGELSVQCSSSKQKEKFLIEIYNTDEIMFHLKLSMHLIQIITYYRRLEASRGSRSFFIYDLAVLCTVQIFQNSPYTEGNATEKR